MTTFTFVSLTAVSWALATAITVYVPGWPGYATAGALVLVGTAMAVGTALTMIDLPEVADLDGDDL